MRISLNWLKDYLDIKPEHSVSAISEALTLAGLEVEAVESLTEKAQKFSIGVIKEITKTDEGCVYTVEALGRNVKVFGPQVLGKPSDLLAFKKNLTSSGKAEVATYGDMGFVGYNEAIIIDDEGAKETLTTLADIKAFDDTIFTLGITPNRADALSHLGVSRELSALLDITGRAPMLTPREMAGPTHERVAIEIDDPKDCPRYACRIIENVVIKDSPFWLKLRLLSTGIRPINNVVDVTNYVMISRGQPMHAFDFDTLEVVNARAKILVKRAASGEKFRALSGEELTLSADDLVISDGIKSFALAGVIGGLSSSVTEATKTILLESAYFDPAHVRKTARRHNISTESSYRFERSTDPNGVVDALNYAARMISELVDAKVCRETIDAYPKRIDPQEIKMRPERAQAVLGMNAESFDQDLLRRRFLRLGIETVAKRGDAIYFRVPTYRSDLLREIDLIEEAARMIGYDKVQSTFLGSDSLIKDFSNPALDKSCAKLKEHLLACSFSEAINYGFLNQDYQDHFLTPEDRKKIITVKNPLSERYNVMRLSLIPGLIKNLVHNQRNQEKSIQLFEVGTVFLGRRDQGSSPNMELLSTSLSHDSFAIEKQVIAGVLYGPTQFIAFDKPPRMVDFYDAKGVISELLTSLSLKDDFFEGSIRYTHNAHVPFLHPDQSSQVHYVSKDSTTQLGYFGKLHPEVAARLEVQGEVFVFELDLDVLASLAPTIKRYKPFSRLPTIERDLAFLVDEGVDASELLSAIAELEESKSTLLSLRIFDVYRGKNIASGKKSIAVALSLQKTDKTLTDEEADGFMDKVVQAVAAKTNGVVRS